VAATGVYFLETTETVRRAPGVITGSRRGFRSGLIKESYFDFDLYLQEPGHIDRAVDLYVAALMWLREQDAIELVAFVKKNDVDDNNTVGVLPLAAAICCDERLWLPQVIVRLDRPPLDRVKVHVAEGTSQPLKGTPTAVLVDHVTTGGELLEAVESLRILGADVKYVVTFAVWLSDYQAQGGHSDALEAALTGTGAKFHYLHTLAPAMVNDVGAPPELIPNRPWLEQLQALYDSSRLASTY
jgi:orotate phosphoribosyltransferase